MDSVGAWRWLGGLLCTLGALHWVNQKHLTVSTNSKKSLQDQVKLEPLHVEYLFVHFLIRLADWLQVNMFNLYLSYGVDIGALFMTGFVTSAICSTFVGRFVDYYGRRNGCLVYCVLEVIIQYLEHFNDFQILLCGRVLGGLSTALLFSAFESWVVSEHKSKKYSPELLTHMFSLASLLNGVSAILAGLIAKVAYTIGGEIAPFQVAMLLSLICGLLILRWNENYGGRESKNQAQGDTIVDRMSLFSNPYIPAYGLLQAMFEGAMYTFVFMWVQTFIALSDSEERPPSEILFSCLMVSMSMGGIIFDILSPYIQKGGGPMIGALIFSLACISMGMVGFALSDVFTKSFLRDMIEPSTLVMFCFCAFEICVGMYDPWMSTMRSIYIPESVLATVMTYIRVPLNILVWVGVHLTENYSLFTVFCVCSLVHFVCFTVILRVTKFAPRHDKLA